MTPQEQQMLKGLADRINRNQLQEKDADAEQYIQQALGRNPDAPYIMAQTILVQQYAVEQAQKQIADLRAQLDQARQHTQEPKHATSFLGNLLGFGADSSREGPPPPPPPMQQRPVQPQYAAGPGYGAGPGYPVGAGYGAPSAGYPMAAPAQGGGFLRSAMQTAAGVAVGALAFEGIESLMHGFGHASGYGTEFGGRGLGSADSTGGLGGDRTETINNYYDGARPHEQGGDLSSIGERQNDISGGHAEGSQFGNGSELGDVGGLHDASNVTDDPADDGTGADDLSGTTDSDYSSDADDSMLADDVGGSDQDFGDTIESGGDDSGDGDLGGGFDSGGGDDGGDGF